MDDTVIEQRTHRPVPLRWSLLPVTLALAVVGALLSGCSQPESPSPSGGRSPDVNQGLTAGPLTASLEVSRLFAGNRQLGLRLANVGQVPIRIDTVQLESPLFATVPPDGRGTVLEPGAPEVLMPVSYGDTRCSADPQDGVLIVVVVANGEELHVEAGEFRAGALAGLHADECAAMALRDHADLRFGDDWEPTGPHSMTGEIILVQRQPGVPISVENVAGTVIFNLDLGQASSPLLAVDDDSTQDRVRVAISADRCDPHALIESKRTYVFPAWVRVGESAAAPVVIQPEGRALAAFKRLFDSCTT